MGVTQVSPFSPELPPSHRGLHAHTIPRGRLVNPYHSRSHFIAMETELGEVMSTHRIRPALKQRARGLHQGCLTPGPYSQAGSPAIVHLIVREMVLMVQELVLIKMLSPDEEHTLKMMVL